MKTLKRFNLSKLNKANLEKNNNN